MERKETGLVVTPLSSITDPETTKTPHNPTQPCIFFLFPTWAEKPVLMAVTDRLEPHELHLEGLALGVIAG